MAVQFLMSGGNFAFSQGAGVAGLWQTVTQMKIVNNAPAGRVDTYSFENTGGGGGFTTPIFSSSYSGLIAGMAFYSASPQNTTIFSFLNSGSLQCELHTNSSNQFTVTRNGTLIGGPSTFSLVNNSWNYIEFKVSFSINLSGTAEVRVNGGVVLSLTGLTNATSVATANALQIGQNISTLLQGYVRDIYVLDTTSGVNQAYLGDVSVIEIYPNGTGAHSQWSNNVGPFSITAVAAGTGVYTGGITGGTGNAYQGYYFVATGFAQTNNNGTFLCTASSSTTLTLANSFSVNDTTGTCSFQAIVQPGISQTGTRPNQDVTYIVDATSGDISDYAHQTYSSSSSAIAAVSQYVYARKDDPSGTRSIALAMLLGATTGLNTIFLGSSYQYFSSVWDADPNSNPWSIINFNTMTFGVKELT